MTDVLDTLQAAIDAGRNVYQDAVAAAQADAADMDERRWRLGDLACLVATEYGRNTIALFAKDTNTSVASMRGYRTVSSFFDRGSTTRVEFANSDVVSWSHFRMALRFRRKYGEQAPQMIDDFVRTVANEALTIEQAGVKLAASIGKDTPPVKLFDGELCAESAGEWIVFRLRIDGSIQPKQPYTVKIYEVEA